MENIIKELKAWVEENYVQHTTGWTYQRSEGNFVDCFDDGYECGHSMAAYDIGCILGMELEEPDELDEEDYF